MRNALPEFRSPAVFLLPALMLFGETVNAEEFTLHTFARQQLTETYFSEGANAGDVNGDQVPDIVYGPYWFAGPNFKTRGEIYEPVPQDVNRYANHFFSWVYDFDGDGWQDVFVVGFPGTPAYVYVNPTGDGLDSHWEKHQVLDWVSNESPQFTDLVGDERPELICTRDGFFGFATVDWERPLEAWDFHPVSAQTASKRFGHGLGVGDINGDGRLDILHAKGWLEQPAADPTQTRWKDHAVSFSNGYGGAEMHAYDVDGDGDNDVITSHQAHDFGLGWYEQVSADPEPTFQHHLIMGSHPSENKYGVLFSELHSVALADIDGDGLKDIVTGKTYWSHHKQSPMWDAGAVVYWFQLVRGESGIDWIPHRADDDSGIGRQISVIDVNTDGNPDLVLGGMKGAHVLVHRAQRVSERVWHQAQPKVYEGERLPKVEGAVARRGPQPAFDEVTQRLPDGVEAESMTAKTTAGKTRVQEMSAFRSGRWSDQRQLFWTGARVGDKLTVDLPKSRGRFDLEVVLTCARDYAIVQLSVDGKALGPPIDLYEPEVGTTGVLSFPDLDFDGDAPRLTVQIVGANSNAKKAFMFGMDCLRLRKSE